MIAAVVVFYVLLIAVIAYAYRGAKDSDDFLSGGRSAGYIQVGAALFTLIGGGEFVTMAALGMLYGLSGSALFIGYAAGFVLLGFLSSRIRRQAAEKRLLSLPDYIYETFGMAPGAIVSIFSFAAFFALLMLQFSAASTVLSALTPISYPVWALIISASILAYLAIGGLRAVFVTDVLQAVAMLILLPVVLYAIFLGPAKNSSPWLGTEPISIVPLFGLFVTGFFVAASSADVWQRAYAAKSDKTCKIGFFLGAALFVVYGVALTLFGIAAARLGVTDSNAAFVQVITTQYSGNALLIGAAALLVTAAISSTADTELFLLTTMLHHELRRHKIVAEDSFWLSKLAGVRTMLLIFGISATVFALYFKDLVDTYTWLLSALIVLSPAIMFSLFAKTSGFGMTVSLMGNALLFGLLVYGGIINLDNVWWIAAPGAALYAMTLFARSTSNKNT